jgi:CelD/BcsL family acetyltransferase involved in cellulose biosynthesis
VIVDVIDRPEALAGLRDAWIDLYRADPEAHVFLSPAWLAPWLELVGDDWTVLIAREDAAADGLSGLFPLRRRSVLDRHAGLTFEILPAGLRWADFTGFLCRPGTEAPTIDAFADALRALGWSHLRLEHLVVSDERLHRLRSALSVAPIDCDELLEPDTSDGIDNSVAPFVRLPAAWETFLATQLSANSRQRARRLLKKLDAGGELAVTHTCADTLARDLDFLIQQWVAKWGARKADPATIQHSLRHYLERMVQAGVADICVLWENDRAIGAHALFVDAIRRAVYFHAGSRDETVTTLPAGFLLHCYAIRRAIAEGFRSYEFLRGDEAYKFSFADEARQLRHLVFRRPAPAVPTDPAMLSKLLDMSGEAQRTRQLQAAHRGYRQVLENQPSALEALFGLAEVEAQRSNYAAAITLYRARLAALPRCGRTWIRLGDALLALGRSPDAVHAFETALTRGRDALADVAVAEAKLAAARAGFEPPSAAVTAADP